jgi:hypothetical protein
MITSLVTTVSTSAAKIMLQFPCDDWEKSIKDFLVDGFMSSKVLIFSFFYLT